jgi:hypothetical protein
MHTCKDCRYYVEKDETKGDCLGREVPATREANKCPMSAFRPKV